MAATFVAGERGVFLIDVAVARFQFLKQRAVLYAAAADIVSEAGKQKTVRTIAAIIGAELRQVLAENTLGFRV